MSMLADLWERLGVFRMLSCNFGVSISTSMYIVVHRALAHWSL